jgi:hypothetical protein
MRLEVGFRFRLRFPQENLPFWAARFEDSEEEAVERLAAAARSRGHLTLSEFLALCRWKTPRSQPGCRKNSAERVRRISRAALAAADESEKMPLLLSLQGVGVATASVILHFCDVRPFPIVDTRALWSLSWTRPPSRTADFWRAYTDFTRSLSRSARIGMRDLDRALWQYSKERQAKQ